MTFRKSKTSISIEESSSQTDKKHRWTDRVEPNRREKAERDKKLNDKLNQAFSKLEESKAVFQKRVEQKRMVLFHLKEHNPK